MCFSGSIGGILWLPRQFVSVVSATGGDAHTFCPRDHRNSWTPTQHIKHRRSHISIEKEGEKIDVQAQWAALQETESHKSCTLPEAKQHSPIRSLSDRWTQVLASDIIASCSENGSQATVDTGEDVLVQCVVQSNPFQAALVATHIGSRRMHLE